MTGPQHYREAERLLTEANRIMDGFPGEQYAQTIATAQAHATLAVAAATALSAGTSYHAVQADMTEWRHAAGNQTAAERDRIGDEP